LAKTLISSELQKFIARHIYSVEQLEILCLLAEGPAKVWSAAEVFTRIQSSQDSVGRHLQYFTEEQFLVRDETMGYRFAPENAELARATLELVKTYREKRVTVIAAIYQTPLDPIRNFADAFKIRKDKP
jgi:DNA-binding transcriptional ArsR family regulator